LLCNSRKESINNSSRLSFVNITHIIDHYLALPSSSAINHQNLPANNQTTPVLANNTPMSLSNPNNPLARLQESTNEQTSNPFDVKIRRPAFKGTL
jgi:hypothetical protein